MIRNYADQGFKELLPPDAVLAVPFESAIASIRQFKPDVVLIIGGLGLDDIQYQPVRAACDRENARLAFWLHDDPYEFDYAYKIEALADVIFTNDSWTLHHYKAKSVFHVPLGADAKTHFREILPAHQRNIGAFFCGVGYPNRVKILMQAKTVLARSNTCVLGDNWPSTLTFAKNQRLTGAEMADYSQRSMITINIGRDMDIANRRFRLPASTPGPRTFETALSGSAQLYFANGLEISDYLEPGKEILLFDGADALNYHMNLINSNPEILIEVARAAQQRALKDHTYKNRAALILNHLQESE